MSAAEEEHLDDEHPRFGIADLIVAIVVGFFFAVSAYGAIGNLIGIPQALAAGGRVDATPWAPLVASVALPVVAFLGALLVARGRGTFARTLILVSALAASSAAGLSLYFAALSALPA